MQIKLSLFRQERFCAWLRFEKDGCWNSEMAYYLSCFTYLRQKKLGHFHSTLFFRFWPLSSSSQCCLSQLTHQFFTPILGGQEDNRVLTILTETVVFNHVVTPCTTLLMTRDRCTPQCKLCGYGYGFQSLVDLNRPFSRSYKER